MIAFARPSVDPDKEAFHRYLNDFEAVDDDGALLEKFSGCTDILPAKYAELLFLPLASTYRDAVALLLSTWSGPFSGACDWYGEDREASWDE